MKMTKQVKATLMAVLIVAMLAIIGIPLLAFVLVGMMSIVFAGLPGEMGVLITVILCIPFMWGLAELSNYLVKHFIEGFTRAG